MDARETELNTRRYDRDDFVPPPPGRGYAAVETDDPDVIKSQIDRTRAEMDQTVDALQHKLSIEHLIDRTIGNLRDSAGRSRVLETIRENPIPTALIGVGLAWLLYDQQHPRQHTYGHAPRQRPLGPPDEVGHGSERDWLAPGAQYWEGSARGSNDGRGVIGRVRNTVQGLTHKVGDVGSTVGERAGDVASRARNAASNIGEQAREGVGRVRDSAEDIANRARNVADDVGSRAREFAYTARERATHLGTDVRQQAQRGQRMFWGTYEENPLVMGAGALCLGLILGLSVPTTRAENKLMGETSDELARKARRLGKKAAETGSRVAETAMHSAKDAVENQDSGDILDKARAAVTSAASTLKEEARREGQTLVKDVKKDIGISGQGGSGKSGQSGGQGAGMNLGQNKPSQQSGMHKQSGQAPGAQKQSGDKSGGSCPSF
jgi:hypothetical protein